jgi:predicted kinase
MDPVTMRGRANTRPRSRVQSADDPGRDAGLSGVTTLAALPVPDTNPVVEPSGELIDSGRVLVAYRGLPGSGKTTHAEAQVTALRQAGTAAARVSRDDIRASMRLTPGAPADRPDRVTAVHHAVITRLFQHGIAVILLDDAHLEPDHLGATTDLAHHLGAALRVVDLRTVPLSTCLSRDARRHSDLRVGATTITALAHRHLPNTD